MRVHVGSHVCARVRVLACVRARECVQIKELEENVGKEEETARDLRLDLSAQHHTVAQLKRDHRISLDTQTRFHDANLSTITRLREKSVSPFI